MTEAVDVDGLDPLELPDGAVRDACLVLAGVALTACGGDPAAAAGALAEVLAAVGVLACEPGQRRACESGRLP